MHCVIASSGSERSQSAACERESVECDGDRAVCQNGYVEEALVADFRAVRAGEHVMEAGGRGNGRVLIAVLTVPRRELASIGRLAGVVGRENGLARHRCGVVDSPIRAY